MVHCEKTPKTNYRRVFVWFATFTRVSVGLLSSLLYTVTFGYIYIYSVATKKKTADESGFMCSPEMNTGGINSSKPITGGRIVWSCSLHCIPALRTDITA